MPGALLACVVVFVGRVVVVTLSARVDVVALARRRNRRLRRACGPAVLWVGPRRLLGRNTAERQRDDWSARSLCVELEPPGCGR